MVVRHAGETVLFISIASLRRQQHALHTSSYGNNGSLVIHPPKLGGMMIVSAPRWHISSANNYGCPLGQVFARGAVWITRSAGEVPIWIQTARVERNEQHC